MTLQVIGAGVGRTGTESLKIALERLFGEPCYHMYEALSRPADLSVWAAAAQGNMPDWDNFFGGFGAAVDAPVAAFWPELMKAYPDALILLSVRDADSWWESVSRTVIPFVQALPSGPVQEMMEALRLSRWPFPYMEESEAKTWFEAHNTRVRSEVPAQRLLEWSPGDGWEPICTALGATVPGEPFPHANTAADFGERHHG